MVQLPRHLEGGPVLLKSHPFINPADSDLSTPPPPPPLTTDVSNGLTGFQEKGGGGLSVYVNVLRPALTLKRSGDLPVSSSPRGSLDVSRCLK